LVFDYGYLEYYCEKCGNESGKMWCKQCHINQLKSNFASWTSGNEKIDDFIQKMQLKINTYDDVIFEWIPYNELVEINEINENDGFATAIWKEGPLSYKRYEKKWIRKSCGKKVYLKYLHNSQDITDALLNMVFEFFYEFRLNINIH
jgi:hypothetical protein